MSEKEKKPTSKSLEIAVQALVDLGIGLLVAWISKHF
jgi:hypothetical protein